MKSVLISIQPKWVEKIANGEKTIEVRKTAPKCGFISIARKASAPMCSTCT